MPELFELPILEGDMSMSPLPNPDEISYFVLEKERKIYLDYEITNDTLALQRMILRWNIEDRAIPAVDRKPIYIYIVSLGGDIFTMRSLIDTIDKSITPVITVNLGVACSAAAMIFIAGHKRLMFPHAYVMIHEGSIGFDGDSTKVLDNTDWYKKDLKLSREYMLSKTKIPPATLSKKKSNDWWLDAADCMKYGICDQIIESIEEII